MACFVVPMLLAMLTTPAQIGLRRSHAVKRLHLGVLNTLLWGGTGMLAVEHLAHGEIVPYPPFLTVGLSQAIPEMMHVGLPMSVAMVGMWGAFVLIVNVASHIKASRALQA